MKKVKIEQFPLGVLRILADQRSEQDKERFYRMIGKSLYQRLEGLDINTLMITIIHEKDSIFREFECEALSGKLVDYVGPISMDRFLVVLQVFPVASVWRLVDAKHPVIRRLALSRVGEILDTYGYEKEECSYQKERKKKI